MNGSQATAAAPTASTKSRMCGKRGLHGEDLRGLTFAAMSPTTQSRFGKLFPMLPPARYEMSGTGSVENLMRLGAEMGLNIAASAAPALPKDGPNDQESGIPALYTYFGQFIGHDITFDPSSSLQKINDPDAVVDFRTPAFDLDSVYGRGPSDQPYM